MKLLLDENISRRLVPAQQIDYPGSSHVVVEGLMAASDCADDVLQALVSQRARIEAAFADRETSMLELLPPVP